MADIKLFNTLFSDCGSAYKPVAVSGLRVGYPQNFWEDLGEEVQDLHLQEALQVGRPSDEACPRRAWMPLRPRWRP